MTTPHPAPEIPALALTVDGVDPMPHAAVPTLRFTLRIDRVGGPPVRSAALTAQLRILPARRGYDDATRERLAELFGAPRDWSRTAESLFWTQATVMVPPFDADVRIELPIACTADFDIVIAKYFHAVGEGEIPLGFLFSGTVFYGGDDGRLMTARLPWDREASFRLPVTVWDEAMAAAYPNGRWLRIEEDTFRRLDRFRVRYTLPSWDRAIELLLTGVETGEFPRPPADPATIRER